MSTFNKSPKSHLMTYRIGRGEQGVLTYEPYKSHLLPHWRFRTVSITHISSETLWSKFLEFYEQDDFVGMDMARKFIQMGMTRSKRYANYKGGKKYVDGKEKWRVVEKSTGHEGREEKEEASRIFREVWERCKSHEGYAELKREFLRQQKEWLKMKGDVKSEDRKEPREVKLKGTSGEIKLELEQEMADESKTASKTRINSEND